MSNSIIFGLKRRMEDLEAEIATLKQKVADLDRRPQMGMYSGSPSFTIDSYVTADPPAEIVKRGRGRPKGTPNGR